jgi:hypothetical protein
LLIDLKFTFDSSLRNPRFVGVVSESTCFVRSKFHVYVLSWVQVLGKDIKIRYDEIMYSLSTILDEKMHLCALTGNNFRRCDEVVGQSHLNCLGLRDGNREEQQAKEECKERKIL